MTDPETGRSVSAALRELRDEEIPPAAYTAVRARVRDRIATHRRPAWGWWTAAAAAATAAVLMLIPPPAPPVLKPGPRMVAIADPAVKAPIPKPRQRPRPVRRRATTAAQHTEPLLIKMLTDDPDVVIYWVVDTKGE
jgi:hypothetical protein